MRELLLVGVGGFLGSVLRYAAANAVQNLAANAVLPYGTLFINLTGAFLLGALMEVLAEGGAFSPEIRLFVGVGILGGYTTFSTLVYESTQLANQSEYAFALLYAFGSIALGLGATVAGIATVRLLMRFVLG
jgi:CrcB protein